MRSPLLRGSRLRGAPLLLLVLAASACSGSDGQAAPGTAAETATTTESTTATATATATATPTATATATATATPTATAACEPSAASAPDGAMPTTRADLDGDGRDDELALAAGAGADLHVRLAEGRSFTVESPFGEVLAVADVDDDGRDEVFGSLPDSTGSTGERRGSVFVLDGCALAPVQAPSGRLDYVYGAGPDRLQAAATVRCVDGRVEQVVTTQAPTPGYRLVRTTRWALSDGRAQDPVTAHDRVPDAQDPAQPTRGTVACG